MDNLDIYSDGQISIISFINNKMFLDSLLDKFVNKNNNGYNTNEGKKFIL